MRERQRRAVVNRLNTARGHVDAVTRMMEGDGDCPDLMKQVSAVQGAPQQANRAILRNPLETCVAEAMAAGRNDEIVEETEALRFDRVAMSPARLDDGPLRPRPRAVRRKDDLR